MNITDIYEAAEKLRKQRTVLLKSRDEILRSKMEGKDEKACLLADLAADIDAELGSLEKSISDHELQQKIRANLPQYLFTKNEKERGVLQTIIKDRVEHQMSQQTTASGKRLGSMLKEKIQKGKITRAEAINQARKCIDSKAGEIAASIILAG